VKFLPGPVYAIRLPLHELEGCTVLLLRMVLAFSFLLSCVPLHAQVGPRGTIAGSVTDESGAAILGARVLALRVSGNLARNVTTDSFGHFVLPEMAPGRYVLHIEAPGFKATEAVAEIGLRNPAPLHR
jgi:hypothetical protein